MKKLWCVPVLSVLMTSAFAENIQLKGTIDQELSLKNKLTLQSKTPAKHVQLMQFHLSNEALENLKKRNVKASLPLKSQNMPNRIQLGMNDVPVLDQGNHGSCVTFAVTAAIDAAIGKGDYISQLCQLELGTTLESLSYTVSGWDGSFGRWVLGQMETYGYMTKEDQKAQGCGGLTEYPVQDSVESKGISLEDFHQMSHSLLGDWETTGVGFSTILDIYDAVLDRTDTDDTLQSVKEALRNQNRVTFAVLFPAVDLGIAGAVGHYKADNDSWVLTTEIARDAYLHADLPGHEMVITGFDDDAVSIDNKGHEHRGLLTLRNSWGDNVGNHGDFYMSYDYFKMLVVEAHRIRS